jgi:hypothetical protein
VFVKAPASLIAGRAGRATVQLRNMGQAAVLGEVDVELFASPDPWLDPEDQPLGSTRRRIGLRPSGQKRTVLAYNVPASLPGGNYYLVARADAGSTVAETREFNNVGASPAALFIGPPAVDFAGTFVREPVVVTRRGVRSALATLALTNGGNVPSAGPVTVSLLASPDGVIDPADATLGSQTRTLRIRPGGRRLLRLRVALPSTLPAGAYRLAARIDPAGAVAESNETNNDAVSGGSFAV